MSMIFDCYFYSLTGSHKEYSGYAGNWVTEPNLFDNEYYSLMMDKTQKWHQEKSNIQNRVQFVNKDGTLSMFNCDIALLYDIDGYLKDEQEYYMNATNLKKCDVENGKCDFQPDTYDIFVKYATNNQQFYNDFVKAWVKMTSIGYNKRMLTRFGLH